MELLDYGQRHRFDRHESHGRRKLHTAGDHLFQRQLRGCHGDQQPAGLAVIAANNTTTQASITTCTAGFLYNVNNGTFTRLTDGINSLLFYDPIPAGFCMDSGHDEAINNDGDVVGYIGAQGTTWHAAEWQPNGSGGPSIVDLNTMYASILPAGVTLNMATAIDNNGDIAWGCTDASGNTMQSFVIYNTAATPEPGTLVLCVAGLVGLLAYACAKGSSQRSVVQPSRRRTVCRAVAHNLNGAERLRPILLLSRNANHVTSFLNDPRGCVADC